MHKNYFITAVGTNIGKTYLTCCLINYIKNIGRKAIALKPVITGWEDGAEENDTLRILSSMEWDIISENIDTISPWRYKAALAPNMAAAIENKEINYSQLLTFCNQKQQGYDFCFIEGAGGVMTPLYRNKTILDLISDLKIDVILVTGSYLGSISHSLTAIKALESIGASINSIIVNNTLVGNNIPIEDTILQLNNFVGYKILPLSLAEHTQTDFKDIENIYHNVNQLSDFNIFPWGFI